MRLNGEWWHIEVVPPFHFGLLRSDGSYALGVCDDNEKTIYINETLDGFKLKKVICHEITHAAMFSYDIDLPFETEELIADIMATFGWEIICNANKIFHHIK
jgi:Zn-dependent peptidase ImmA (M78 family)